MYGIAVSTMACLRGGTRVDVAWSLEPERTPQFDPADAVAITPGGGRLGSLFGGALDGQLVELAQIERTRGRIVELAPSVTESRQLGIDDGSTIRCALVPALELPDQLWPLLQARSPVALVSHVDGDEIELTEVYGDHDPTDAGDDVAGLLRRAESTVVETPRTIITVLAPRPTLIVFGAGEIPRAISDLAEHFGWSTLATNTAGDAAALASTLSAIDGVVVFGHDPEMTGRVLGAALAGEVGYIGSIGPRPVRDAREDWLAYQGVTDLGRVCSPAGLDIGATTPKEIALAVVGEMIARRNLRG